jgi:hypothetical protein
LTQPGYKDANGVYHQPDINGQDSLYNPPPWTNLQNPPVQIDNVGFATQMSNNYHIHAFIGIYYNGQEYAIPRGIGIDQPLNSNDLEINYATNPGDFYYLHSHDSTGVIHVEDPSTTPVTQSIYTLKNILDVWGVQLTPFGLGSMQGTVTAYTSGQVYRGGGNCSGSTPPPGTPIGNGTTPESTLTQWTGDPNTIPIYSHEVIWLFIGVGNPTALPNIDFYEEC